MTIIRNGIHLKNYKCFNTSIGGGLEKILPINIIIGKNNSGKSSLIDLIRFIVKPQKEFFDNTRNNSIPEVLVEHILTEKEILSIFKSDTSGGGIPGNTHFQYGRNFIDSKYTYSIKEKGHEFKSIDADYIKEATKYIEKLANVIQNPFKEKIFIHLTSERDISPEAQVQQIELSPNGSGATNYIQEIINRAKYESHLIEEELLRELNNIINPDIKFKRIFVQLEDNGYWEIFFDDSSNNRIALSKMGSGIKTVLLVLLHLIVSPVFNKIDKSKYVFAFEELENNLHPALQRRLYNFIKEYSEKHSCYFFLTTHSNIVIDSFGTYENAQLIHLLNNGEYSTATTILSQIGTKRVIKDLDVKASDILQSNGIIWVEGPSDRNYLNRWIELISPDLQEGLHYSIMFYGGRLLSNLSFDYEWFNNEVIPLLKINTNAFVIIDRDGKNINAKLNNTKERINEEIGNENCWITRGREIENYLTDKTIQKWLLNKHNYEVNFKGDVNTKLEDNILKSDNRIKLKYNLSKTVYSGEIVEFINDQSINVLDLKSRIEHLIVAIREWNT